jgi:hypothetical protein
MDTNISTTLQSGDSHCSRNSFDEGMIPRAAAECGAIAHESIPSNTGSELKADAGSRTHTGEIFRFAGEFVDKYLDKLHITPAPMRPLRPGQHSESVAQGQAPLAE